MKLSEICIKRPVLAWVLVIVIVAFGAITWQRMSIRENPKCESQMIQIEKEYHGVSAELVESKITKVIEDCISGVECIKDIHSVSADGVSRVFVVVDDSRSVDDALNDIRDRLASAADIFPRESRQPTYHKATYDTRPVFYLCLKSDILNKTELYNYAKNDIVRVLESIPGVARSDVYGAGEYEMKIKLDPQRMSFYRITPSDVKEALRKQNFNISIGKIVNNNKEYSVTARAGLQTPEEFNNIPISRRNGSVVKLKDIGEASLESKTRGQYSMINGDEVVSVSIVPQTTANPVSIARIAKEKIEHIKKVAPDSIELSVVGDSTKFIEESLSAVQKTILEAIAIILAIVLFFLNSVKASVVPLITIPVSLIGAIAIMYLFGFTINTITLMSLVLAVGLVVDDAIVILENVYKYIERGYGPFKAAIDGTKEVSFAVIAMTLTLCFVYTPIALAKGEMGAFYREFAITLSGAVLLSGFVALTLSPMMCSRLLSSHRPGNHHSSFKHLTSFCNRIVHAIESFYVSILNAVLRHRLLLVVIAVLFISIGIFVFNNVPKDSMPYQDKRMIYMDGYSPNISTLDYTKKYVMQLDRLLAQNKDIKERHLSIQNSTSLSGILVISDDCKQSTSTVMDQINSQLLDVAGLTILMRDRQSNDNSGGGQIKCAIRGNKSFKELKKCENDFAKALLMHSDKVATGKNVLFRNIFYAANDEIVSYEVDVLRDKATVFGVDPYIIADTLEGLMRGGCYGKFDKDQKECDIIIDAEDDCKRTPEQLFDVYVKAYSESYAEVSIPLSELISVNMNMNPSTITRINRTRARTLTIELAKNVSMSDAIYKLENIAKNTLDKDVQLEFIGSTKKYIEESDTTIYIILIAIFLIYLVMAAQFESWTDPFIILLTFPFAMVGGVIALWLTRDTVNMYSNIGFLTLIGLIAKHGILIVDFANKLVAEGLRFKEAAYKASKMRFRPILMTTAAMVLGAMPLAFASGPGCETRRSLGATIVGGMTVGTLFTILVVPVLYTFFARIKRVNRIKVEYSI